eukprot:m.107134 g.107134  ORF g.107134 m.107134 type:complete len:473 (+) comp27771_c0_seq4:279-1697(+)
MSTSATEPLGFGLPIPPTMHQKTGWMHVELRAILVALRPWSFPASITPIAVTAALLHERTSLFSMNLLYTFFTVIFFHATANLFNTYYDFVSGVDTKELADDRGLVDNTVSPATVWKLACGCGASGLVSGFMLATSVENSTTIWCILIPTLLLCWMYTAHTSNLKGRGLGEITVFLLFGPMLMATVSLALIEEVPSVVYGYSVPLGLLTVAVLHVNNSRDVKVDAKAGLTTIAIHLQQDGNVELLQWLLGLAYASIFVLMFLFQTSYRQCFVTLCIPWALYISRRAKANLYFELPQFVGQHNLMFGVILTAALAAPAFTARVLTTNLYLLGGINNIVMWEHARVLVHMKITNVVPGLSPTLTLFAFVGAVGVQIGLSFLFIIGYEPILMAKLLFAWIVPVTFFTHDFWTIEYNNKAFDTTALDEPKKSHTISSRQVPTFLTEFDNEFVHFFKNVGMAGGLVVYIELSEQLAH